MRARHRGEAHDLREGARVDGFRVGPLLHEGGMARLYRVTHPRHRLPLVLKTPRFGPQAPLSAWAAFENELRVLERLKGPHVPRLIAWREDVEPPYLVMEYLAGDALAQAARRAPLGIEPLCDLGARLCKAVHELHRQNTIHLDLNPGNVRDRAGGEMVLIDYGLAHHTALPDLIDAAFGEEEGTTPYIAPEQVRHLRTESRSDIFAIGAILYLLATGRYPFGRPNLLSLRRRLYAPPPPPRLHNPQVPPWLQEVILRCLEIHPRDRYATAKQVAYLLSHPGAVHCTRRAQRTRPLGPLARARLWLESLHERFDDLARGQPRERLVASPHVLVALDLAHASEPLREALRTAVRKFARSEPHSYFTCYAVLTESAARGLRTEEPASAVAAVRLSALRNWAQPLHLPAERIHFQIGIGEPATTILDYARHHVVDYIILGARGSSAVRRFLGSVSARVTAEAPCTVTVVRTRRDAQGRASVAGGRKPGATGAPAKLRKKRASSAAARVRASARAE